MKSFASLVFCVICMIVLPARGLAQSPVLDAILSKASPQEYIIFERTPLFEDRDVASFKVRYTDIELQSKDTTGGSNWHLYNMYFSNYKFEPSGLDKKAFMAGNEDFNKFANEVLFVLMPNTLSKPMVKEKISADKLASLKIIAPQDLLQNAISNLYRRFTEWEISGTHKRPGGALNRHYQLILKEGKDHYLIKAQLVIQWFLVDAASYTFPTQYHLNEINIADPEYSRHYTPKQWRDMLYQYVPPRAESWNLSYKTVPASADSIASLPYLNNGTRYYSYPSIGISPFVFIKGLGIVNGYYKRAFVEADDYSETINFSVQSINGLPLKKVSELMKSRDPNAGKIMIRS